jgi:hypothetical protein
MYYIASRSADFSETIFNLQYIKTRTMKLRKVIFDKVSLLSVNFANRENGGIEGTLKNFFLFKFWWHYMMKCLFWLMFLSEYQSALMKRGCVYSRTFWSLIEEANIDIIFNTNFCSMTVKYKLLYFMLCRHACSCEFPNFSEDPLCPHSAYRLIMEAAD